jgi:probable phosphoglycerate mutase
VEVIFVRHGEAKPSQGPLSELGLEQVADLAATLQDDPVTAVYTSMMTRAFQTGAAVAESHDLPLLADSRLNEVDLNEGIGDADKTVEIPRRMAAWLNGEDREKGYSTEGDYDVLNDRFHSWWTEFADQFRQDEGTVVVAAHFATLSLMLPTICEGSDLTPDFILKEHPLANTSMVRAHLDAEGTRTCEEWDGAPIPAS